LTDESRQVRDLLLREFALEGRHTVAAAGYYFDGLLFGHGNAFEGGRAVRRSFPSPPVARCTVLQIDGTR